MRPSIERTLLAWILGVMSLGSVMVALAAYLTTLEEMNEFFDANLRAVTETLARRDDLAPGARAASASAAASAAAAVGEYDIVSMAWSPDGRRLFVSHAGVELPFTTREGLSHVNAGGLEWVVQTNVGAHGVTQAAQSVAARRHMAGESARDVVPPLLLMVAAVAALLAFGLRRGLRPLDAAAADIAARSAATLSPIPATDVPRELVPLVRSINGLMERLGATMGQQRRFLADAAHELRTPLTALKLQQQLLERSPDETSRREALARMEQGIERAQRLVEQLLQIARAEPDGEALQLQAVNLAKLARDTVADFAPRAEHLGIDLGAGPLGEAVVRGDLQQLRVLLNNLVDNALRYTPAGGTVDVAVVERAGRPALVVSDNGPGVPPAERPRVFDRFFRGQAAQGNARSGAGSGLGLAIVQAVAARHGATVQLTTPAAGQGLQVEVVFAPAS